MAGILRTDTIQNSNTSTIITQTNSTTLTIGTSGQTVALAAGATSSGFGATYNGAVNWDTTPKTSGFTAVSGTGYFVNTTSGAITVTLPSTPSAGAIVAITDYAGTAATNNITIGRNGSNIEAVAADVTISTNRDSITLVYIDATQGWLPVNDNTGTLISPFVAATGGTITTCGNCKIHTFTGPGSFVVTNAGSPTGSTTINYLVVAGGGGGSKSGAGAGAGGFRTNYPSPAIAGLPVAATTYPITVGAGGARAVTPTASSCGSRGDSSIFSTITSTGGGGASGTAGPTVPANTPGGSGGGGSSFDTPGSNAGGAGNTPPVSPSQGNPGGNGYGISGTCSNGGGGGGGAGAAGSSSPGPGTGGNGTANSITGTSVTYAGGGGSSGQPGYSTGPAPGGGGRGGPSATSGTANTGGGGGGSTGYTPTVAGIGGSGIVVIRYKYQ
jgi:hypothetical protein